MNRRQGRPRFKGMARADWERARVQRFNELEAAKGPRERVHEILNQELPESLIDPEAIPTPPPCSKTGRPQKNCGHLEFERKLDRRGYSYCAACKRDLARQKWQRTHKQRRARVA